MKYDCKTILIIPQILNNVFQFIKCYYIIIVNIAISGPKQKSDHHSRRCSFLSHSPCQTLGHLLNRYSLCNCNVISKLYSRHHERQSKIRVSLSWKDLESSQGDTKKINNYSAGMVDIQAACVQSEWKRKFFQKIWCLCWILKDSRIRKYWLRYWREEKVIPKEAQISVMSTFPPGKHHWNLFPPLYPNCHYFIADPQDFS